MGLIFFFHLKHSLFPKGLIGLKYLNSSERVSSLHYPSTSNNVKAFGTLRFLNMQNNLNNPNTVALLIIIIGNSFNYLEVYKIRAS